MSERKYKRSVGPDLSKEFIKILKRKNISVEKKKRGLFVINQIPVILASNNNMDPKEPFFWGIGDKYLRDITKDSPYLVVLIGGRNFGSDDFKDIMASKKMTESHEEFFKNVNLEYVFLFDAKWVWNQIKGYDPTSTKWKRRNFKINFKDKFRMTLEKEKYPGKFVKETALNKYDKLGISEEDQGFLRSTIKPLDYKNEKIFNEMAEIRKIKDREEKIKKEYKRVKTEDVEDDLRSLNELLDRIFRDVGFSDLLLHNFRRYSDTQLEHLVASLLSDIYTNHECLITRKRGRGSQPLGDILLRMDIPISDEKEHIMVEVKGGTDPSKPRRISSREITNFVGKLVKANITEGIFVTNGVFSSSVKNDIAKFRERFGCKIHTIDGEKLVQLCIDNMRLKTEPKYE